MSESVAKLSVSVPSELAKAVRRRVGGRGLSGFVAQALAHELEREQLGSFLQELLDMTSELPMVWCVLMSQRKIVPSRLPDASIWPSLLKATFNSWSV
jgi:hypothetical protein